MHSPDVPVPGDAHRDLHTATPRVAVIADYAEEGWPSMDLAAEMLIDQLSSMTGRSRIQPELIRPAFKRRFAADVAPSRAHNLDRLLNRFVDYPAELRAMRKGFDLFHVVDHSYAHLVHSLPPRRTIVTCHDLDAFRSLLEPEQEKRSWAFRAGTRRILSGLTRAARVICVSASTRDDILRHRLVPENRLRVIPNGVHPSLSPQPDPVADALATDLIGYPKGQKPEILHVGSTIPRKGVEFLLQLFADLLRTNPDAVLLRVGGAFTSRQEEMVSQLGIAEAVRVLPHLDRRTLAAVYRRADVLLQPSEREGFGLPIVEALASGTPVLASELKVFREVGGKAIGYAAIGDRDAWLGSLKALLQEKERDPVAWKRRRERGIQHAHEFSWDTNARRTLEIYEEILN